MKSTVYLPFRLIATTNEPFGARYVTFGTEMDNKHTYKFTFITVSNKIMLTKPGFSCMTN
jgi:hypothetical protein